MEFGLIDDRPLASSLSPQQISYPDMAPPIFFKGMGIICGLCVCAGAGSLAFTLLIIFFKAVGGSVPINIVQFTAACRVFLYSVWILGTIAGQSFAAVLGRWIGAVWVISVFNAIAFLLAYLAFGRLPILFPFVFVPFIIAYFLQRNPFVLRKVATGTIWRRGIDQ